MSTRAPILFGKYQLLSQIARGGMAEVWKAKAHGVEGFEKVLVIKRILPGLSENPRFVEMFINEAKIAVTLSHANVVQVFDLGQVDGSYYIAMEYVAGMDLSTVLKRLGRQEAHLAPGIAVYVISEVAKGLDYAHRRRDSDGHPLNIVHRDVSPQNILLSLEGEVKLTDFGIAKARTLAQQVTELGVVKGKYAYMAPEQLLGGKLDARADVFAAGILLYETLSGQNPFQSNTTYDTLQRVREGHVTPIEELVPGLCEELGRCVRKAMAFKPEDRYPTAGELYEDLIRYLYSAGQRVGARELAEQLRKLRLPRERVERGTDLKSVFDVEQFTAFEERILQDSAAQADDRTRVGRKVGRESLPSTTPHRERSERRDVTAMCLVQEHGDALREATIRALVERFGGTLIDPLEVAPSEQQTLLFALFGDRVPDGRDSENAARSALRLARAATASSAAAGETSSVAIALQSGRVLIDLGGELIREQHLDEILREARLNAVQAGAGQVLVDSGTERELRTRFRLVSGPSQVDGKPVHLLASERSMSDAYGRFIGRRDVLKAIGESLAKANRGKLRIIGLTGEAGAGKSRILVETMRRLNLAGHSASLHAASLTPQLREVPMAAMQEMLREVLGVDEFDPEALLRDRTTRLRELGLMPAEQGAVAAVLGLPTEQPRAGQRLLKAALARIVRKLAEDRLTIFAWDGAEYMDEDSQRIIGELLLNSPKARVAVVLSYRPGFVPALSTHRHFREIRLGPLRDEEVARLTATRLGADEIPFELLREVTSKSSGNPLYVEEHIKALQEAGAVVFDEGQVVYRPQVAQVDVPKTLRGIIASRIARLTPQTRYLLQVAALCGDRFNVDVVAAAADEAVASVASAFDQDTLQGIVGGRGAQDRVFAHGLVRQVVVESVTPAAQREIHQALAEAIVALRPDMEDELAGRLSRHYEAAGAHSTAVDCLMKAATHLAREGAFAGAIAALERAIQIEADSAGDSERLFSLYERVAMLAYRGRDLLRGVDLLGHGIRRAEAVHAQRWVACFCMWRGRLLAAASRIEEGGRWLDQAQHVARGLTDAQLSRDVFVASADVDARRGLFERAVGYLREALHLASLDDDPLPTLRCLIPLALTYARMGDQQSALSTLRDVQQMAESLSVEPLLVCDIHRLEAQIHYHMRDQRVVAAAATRAVQVAREANLAFEEALNCHHVGEAYLRLGDHRRAFSALRTSYELATERGFSRLQMSNLRALGFIDATRFGSAEGRARVAQAISYAEKHNYVWDIIDGKYLLSIIEQSRGAEEVARQLLIDVRALAEQHSHRRYIQDADDALRCLEDSQPIPLPE